jgi:hypothetical protein
LITYGLHQRAGLISRVRDCPSVSTHPYGWVLHSHPCCIESCFGNKFHFAM